MSIETLSQSADFTARWQRWHDERVARVTAPFGVASLVSTTWLTPRPERIGGVPGLWRAAGPHAVGTGLLRSGYRTAAANVPDEVQLAAGESITDGLREVRGFSRDGVPAVRLLDSTAPGRAHLAGIETYPPDPSWRLPARFEPDDARRVVVAIDGHTSVAPPGGWLVVSYEGIERRLVARRTGQGYHVVFSDATNGSTTYRFRFLSIEAAADGDLVADFNRAYLPPCAFSDAYVCPVPPAENRLELAVRAGERAIRLG